MTYIRLGGVEITIEKKDRTEYICKLQFNAHELDESKLAERLHEAVAYTPAKEREPFWGNEKEGEK
jgi:prophage maintenance system killer protein